MSLGPITIFDKSALQSFNVDEACWFGHFYLINITPLFFVETLADLKKEMAKGRAPEEVVGSIADKTPPEGVPNVNHRELSVAELMGYKLDMRRVPIVAGGRPVKSPSQRGLIFEPAPEMKALQRWQEGAFLEVEYQYASAWRLALQRRTSEEGGEWVRVMGGFQAHPRDLSEAKRLAEHVVCSDRHRYALLKVAFQTFGISSLERSSIIKRWKDEGGPPFREFAPYTAHILTVDAFFQIALEASLISRERGSNRADMAYLYYLPFCMIFVSNDRLHAKTAPLFLRSDQTFLDGKELKADLARLDQYYSALPPEVRERGIIAFAPDPPEDTQFVTTRMWDRFLPAWRETKKNRRPREPEEDARLVAHLKKITELPRGEPGTALGLGEPDFVTFERSIPIRMGKWRLIPPEAEHQGS